MFSFHSNPFQNIQQYGPKTSSILSLLHLSFKRSKFNEYKNRLSSEKGHCPSQNQDLSIIDYSFLFCCLLYSSPGFDYAQSNSKAEFGM